jgi:hypothetical protein
MDRSSPISWTTDFSSARMPSGLRRRSKVMQSAEEQGLIVCGVSLSGGEDDVIRSSDKQMAYIKLERRARSHEVTIVSHRTSGACDSQANQIEYYGNRE